MTTTTEPNGNALAKPPAVPVQLSTEHESPFAHEKAFALAQRMAKALSESKAVPESYQGNIGSCLVALELSFRTGLSPFTVMQNLYIVYGNPAWSAKFLIGLANSSGKFSRLRYEWQGTKGQPTWGCRAIATDLASGEVLEGPWITWELVQAEGWSTKNGSKWKTMAMKMFPKRAGAWWVDQYCPEIALGLQTQEELIDAEGEPVAASASFKVPGVSGGGARALESVIGMPEPAQLPLGGEREPGEDG